MSEQYYLGLARQWKTKAVENWHSYFFIKEVFTNKMNRTQLFFKNPQAGCLPSSGMDVSVLGIRN